MRPELLLGVLVLAGCGGAAVHAPASPEASAAPEDELGELDRAEAELDGALRALTAPRFAAPPPSPVSASPPRPTAAPSGEAGKAARVDEERTAPSAGATTDRAQQAPSPSVAAGGAPAADRCAIACNALASMTRATERLCELRGGDDARCVEARARVEGAAARVRSACPTCHD